MQMIKPLKELFRKYRNQLRTLSLLSGRQATYFLAISMVVGGGMGMVEYFFAFYLQNFFSKLGLISTPQQYAFLLPKSIDFSIIVLLLVGLIRFVFQFLRIFTSRVAQQSFCDAQRTKIIEFHLRKAHLSSSSETLALFNEEVQRGGTAFMNLSNFIIASTSSVLLFLMLIFTESYAALISLVFLAIIYFPFKLVSDLASVHGKTLSSYWSKINSFFVDGIRNNFYLRLSNQIESTIESSHKYLNLYFRTYKKTFAILAAKFTLPPLVGLLMVTFVAYTQVVILEKKNLDTLLVFFYLFLRFTQESSNAVASFSEFILHSSSIKRLLMWYRRMSDQPFRDHVIPKSPKSDPIEINSIACKEISFSYDDKVGLFNSFSIELHRGDSLVVMGASGSGKSTLLSLLLGLESPNSGKILVNGSQAITDLASQFYDKIGYVGPVPFLVSGTIRDNLLYANPKAQSIMDATLDDAINFVDLTETIISLPNGLDTKLDEMGTTLSSGQKQRLMLARALVREPDILVLDEATANLDSDTENIIISNLEKVRPQIITIIVSHRDTFKRISTHYLRL